MGITGSTKPRRTWGLKTVFRVAIFLIIGLIVAVFVNYRFSARNIQGPTPPEDTRAALSINRFEHVAMKDGRKQWRLTADSASVFSDRDEAVLKELEATFYLKENGSIHLEADHGRVDTLSKDIAAHGTVIARHPRYTLKTENLKYRQESHILEFADPVEITGESVRLRSDAARYDLNTGTIIMEGHVETWINESFSE